MDEASEREFADYFRARRETVRRTAYMMCGDWHKADDHAQAAFVALHRNWRKIRDPRALDGWMRRTLLDSVEAELLAVNAGVQMFVPRPTLAALLEETRCGAADRSYLLQVLLILELWLRENRVRAAA